MLKLDYTFTAETPLQTFGDNNVGQLRKLRREKRLLKSPETFSSKFSSEDEIRDAIVYLIKSIWSRLDIENMDKTRLYGIYDELQAKLVNAAACQTKYQFLNRICESFDIKSLNEDKLLLDILEKFNDEELLHYIREQSQFLVLKFRIQKEKDKEDKKNNKEQEQFKLNEEDDSSPAFRFVKSFETVPYIAGNSIRGHLRRVLMRDFCKQVGITEIDKNIYHQLFTGGNLGDSTGSENIERREEFIKMCPPIGLLGSAISTQTIQGDLKVIGARLKCIENGTGDLSYWNFIENKFQTRHDTSKQEDEIKIIQNDTTTKKVATQMIYWSESFIVGSEFDSSFIVTSEDELIVSCFWRMIELFKENNFIGGNSARDAGMIKLNINIDENSSKYYLDYLQSNKQQIAKFFGL